MKQFTSFLLVGGVNTLFGYLVFCVATYLGASASIALIISYICGITFNFYSTGHFVFGQTGKEKIVKFVMVYVLIFALNRLTLELLDQHLNSYYISQAIITPFIALLSFFSLKKIVFSDDKQ